jgi:lipopolysaccharide biosynthesis glycosyltransferase
MRKSIPIVTGSDDNYALGVAGLIASLGRTNTGVDLTVLSLGISSENQSRLIALGNAYAVTVSIIEIDKALVERLQVKRKHITAATFLRLLIPDLFPSAENLLYLDCDMIVVGSLAPLFDIDLGENLIGAVIDPPPNDVAEEHISHRDINAGMLLMNIPAWIQQRVADTCLGLLSDPSSNFTFEDQSAINQVCLGKISFLPLQWNTHATHALRQDYIFSSPEEMKILHFVGDIKPWNATTVFSPLWWRLFKGMDLKIPPKGKISYSRKLSRLNLKRREFFAKILGKSKAQQQIRFEAELRNKIIPMLTNRLNL